MMTGIIVPGREAVLKLVIFDEKDVAIDIKAIIDTGFTGNLTLPTSIISKLGLHWQRIGRAILTNSSEVLTNIYECTLLWDGHRVTMSITESESDPLIGMLIMYGFELLMPIIDGAMFTLRLISAP